MPSSNEVYEKFLGGAFIAIAEYRGFTPEVMRYRDKKTGASVARKIAVHSVEVGERQVKVTEWLPDDIKDEQIKREHAKGAKVVLQFDKLEQTGGVYTASGKILPYLEPVKAIK